MSSRLDIEIARLRDENNALKHMGMSYPMIALTGYGRSGKDTVALAIKSQKGKYTFNAGSILTIGYNTIAFSDYIKSHWNNKRWILGKFLFGYYCSKNLSKERNEEVCKAVKFYEKNPHAFISNEDAVKLSVRPLLEEYGMFRYDNILTEMFTDLKAPSVNCRLMRVKEAEAWTQAGGVVWEIRRPNEECPRDYNYLSLDETWWEAKTYFNCQTQFEFKTQQEMRASGLITKTIINDGSVAKLFGKMKQALHSEYGENQLI